MGRKCCVKNCPSGRMVDGTVRNTASLFSLPKNKETRTKWVLFLQANGLKNVPKTAYVCEIHFTEDEVKREFKCVDADGNILLQRKFGHASLVSGAVPTIFSSIPNHNNDIVQQPVVESLSHTETSIIARNSQDELQPTLTGDIEPVVETVTPVTMSNCTEETPSEDLSQKPPDEENQSLFYQIFDQTTILQLPDTSWGVHRLNFAEKLISFTQMRCLPTENDRQPCTVKQITFDENLNFKTYILNKCIPMLKENPQTITEMKSLIEDFHNTTVCTGGPRVAMYKNVVLRSAYRDVCNRWRHNLCPLQTGGESTCKYCVRVYRSADAHYRVCNKSRMLRLPLSSSKRKKIDVLRKVERTQTQASHRNQIRLSHVRDELKTLSEKNFPKVSFEEVIKKLIIPDNRVQCSTTSSDPHATKIVKIK